MRSRLARLIILAFGVLLAVAGGEPSSAAPLPPASLVPAGVAAPILPIQDAQRDCQTVRTCRYDRNGPYRGCLSSYTCRVCKFVQSTCRTEAGKRVCRELRCSWGG